MSSPLYNTMEYRLHSLGVDPEFETVVAPLTMISKNTTRGQLQETKS